MNRPAPPSPGTAGHILEPLQAAFPPDAGAARLTPAETGAATAGEISLHWNRLGQGLRAWRILADGNSYLLLALDASAEQEVDDAWAASPSRGWLLHCLARELLMTACREFLPEIASTGCTPLPRAGSGLRAALAQAGVPARKDHTLSRRFALLTYFPYRGACGVCVLRPQCPDPKGLPPAAGGNDFPRAP